MNLDGIDKINFLAEKSFIMKINFSTLPISAMALSIVVTGCTSNTDSSSTSSAVNSDVQNVAISEPKASIDNIAYDVSVNDSETQQDAKFFTYPYQHGAEIEPAMGGTLVMKNGCMLIQSGDRLNVPIFPHGITTWNEDTQVLTANGVDIPLNTELFTNGPLDGGKYDPNYDYNFEQQADSKCLEGRYIQFLGSQFIDVKDLQNR